jgi:guanylate kinase
MSSKLFIISGPSGSGKSSIARAVMTNEVVSFTTRQPRAGEVNGRDYIFISQEKFDYLLNSNGLAEYTTYYGNASYGITMDELRYRLEKGDAFVVVDIVGKRQLEEIYPNTVSVFVWVPYAGILENRMMSRGDSWENIQKRAKTMDEENNNFYEYDYLIDNTGNFEDSIEAFKAIVSGEFDTSIE